MLSHWRESVLFLYSMNKANIHICYNGSRVVPTHIESMSNISFHMHSTLSYQKCNVGMIWIAVIIPACIVLPERSKSYKNQTTEFPKIIIKKGPSMSHKPQRWLLFKTSPHKTAQILSSMLEAQVFTQRI